MKALMVNSTTSAKIVDNKMRDEIYMRHLREVEKINNREAEKITHDVKSYRSINDLHHKHKAYASYWQNKEEEVLIEQMNDRMKKKMREIKSYLDHRTLKANTQDCSRTSRVEDKSPQPQEPKEVGEAGKGSEGEGQKASPQGKKQKQHQSLHYRYRKRRQEEIDHENEKLQRGILSQRSTYLPQIIKNRQSLTVMGKKKIERQDKSEEKESK